MNNNLWLHYNLKVFVIIFLFIYILLKLNNEGTKD